MPKRKIFTAISVLLLASLAGLVLTYYSPKASALPTPPPSAADLVEEYNLLTVGNTPQINLKLKHNGLTLTPDGIETSELSYTVSVREINRSNDINANRHLTPKEEAGPGGTYSYYTEYDFLASNVPNPIATCGNIELTKKAYIGQKNRPQRPGTDGWPYANWWTEWEAVLDYESSNVGGYLCFSVYNHRPSGGSNFIVSDQRYLHRIAPPTLAASALTYQASTQSQRTTLTATLPDRGSIKIYKHSIAQVPKGTANCNSDSFSFKAIAASDSSGRYTATISNSNKTVVVDFLKPGWDKTYCFAVWDNEGRRGVSAPVVIPPPQSVKIITTGNKWVFENYSAQFACPIPGYLGLTGNAGDTTRYIKTTGGGIPGSTNGVNVLTNRRITSGLSLVAKTSNAGPFTLSDQLKYIHDALSYTDSGELPGPSWGLNALTGRLYAAGVRDHKVSASALSGLVFNLQAAFTIELERPATTRTTVRYTTGGGPTSGVSKATGTQTTAFGEIRLDGTEDYVVKQGDVVFEPGERRKFVFVPIINDCVDDSDERVYFSLNDPNGSTGDVTLDRWFAANSSPVDYYIIKNHDGSPQANKKPARPPIRIPQTPQPDPDPEPENTPTPEQEQTPDQDTGGSDDNQPPGGETDTGGQTDTQTRTPPPGNSPRTTTRTTTSTTPRSTGTPQTTTQARTDNSQTPQQTLPQDGGGSGNDDDRQTTAETDTGRPVAGQTQDDNGRQSGQRPTALAQNDPDNDGGQGDNSPKPGNQQAQVAVVSAGAAGSDDRSAAETTSGNNATLIILAIIVGLIIILAAYLRLYDDQRPIFKWLRDKLHLR